MKSCILASGSKGNCTFIETKNHKILLDMGKNKKYIVESLKSIGVNPSDIDIILISHTHSDHISSLETFIKQYKATVCMPEEMFASLNSLQNYEHIKIYDDLIDLGDMKIYAIKSSHDAIASRNFIIEEDDKAIVQVTDTGYIKSKYFKLLKNREVYFMESNHDIEMLTHGPYPDYLKKRVLSDEGHLSNNQASYYLSKLVGDKTKYIILAHLSEDDNKEELALSMLDEKLSNSNKTVEHKGVAYQHKRIDVIEV